MPDTMTVTILADGTIKTEIVGKVSAPNHATADAFVREVARLAGGETVSRRIGPGHSHGHTHHHHDGGHSHE